VSSVETHNALSIQCEPALQPVLRAVESSHSLPIWCERVAVLPSSLLFVLLPVTLHSPCRFDSEFLRRDCLSILFRYDGNFLHPSGAEATGTLVHALEDRFHFAHVHRRHSSHEESCRDFRPRNWLTFRICQFDSHGIAPI